MPSTQHSACRCESGRGVGGLRQGPAGPGLATDDAGL